MALTPGMKLGPYEVLEPVGAGGMGEVYKARDSRLDRVVAVKVLPDRTVDNPDIRARFEREAKAISSLNHPNICTLFDIGQQDGHDYLVMEYIEGETLTDRLKRGPIEVNEALHIAAQIADALDKAHQQGLIHRDLKPGNVMLTKTGPKLLDFGLAKLHGQDEAVQSISAITRTTPLTGAGTLIGTMQYMSPEQLEGREADARSDIFAFGATLFEMIAGHAAFEAKSQASLIAAIIEREPPALSAIRPMAPPALSRLVKKCMAKDPDQRWQSVRDLADELRWIAQSGSQAGISAPLSAKRRFRFRLAWVSAAVLLLSTAAFAYMWFTRPMPEPRVRRFTINEPVGSVGMNWPLISPDGKNLAFLASDTTGTTSIWLRPMNSLDAYALPGTQGALRPFWSPDSKYLAYFMNDGKLKKIPVAGGPAQLVGGAEGGADGSWGAKDIILFDGALSDSLRQISASGGSPSGATKLNKDRGDRFHAWPSFLPDGDHFLYMVSRDSTTNVGAGDELWIGSLSSDEAKFLINVGSRAVYSKAGYVLYVRDEVLLAHPFDVNKLEFTGEARPVAENLNVSASNSNANFSVSDEGTLVIASGQVAAQYPIVLVDRDGTVADTIVGLGDYAEVQLSRDEKFLAYTQLDPSQRTYDIWIRDLERNVSSRLTFEKTDESNPFFSIDGSTLYYTRGVLPLMRVYSRSADGTGAENRMFPWDSTHYLLTDISPDGTTLALTRIDTRGDVIIRAIDATDSTQDKMVAVTSAIEWGGVFSPDMKYMAYVSDESGRNEIYVRRLEESGGKWQVSNSSGFTPKWIRGTNEIIYSTTEKDFKAVKMNTEGKLQIGVPKQVFSWKFYGRQFAINQYTVTNDAQGVVLIAAAASESSGRTFRVVQDWLAEFQRR